VEQELLTILVHLSSSLSYSEVLSAQSLVFCLVLVEQELLVIRHGQQCTYINTNNIDKT
jgi:uncharacterized beta-barrel protein YwiB (DUF1934 family)